MTQNDRSGVTQWVFFLALGIVLASCNSRQAEENPEPLVPMTYVGVAGEAPTDLLVADANQDGLKDILAVYHAHNMAKLFLQNQEKQFVLDKTLPQTIVGFHPGALYSLDGANLLLLAAEGSDQLRLLQMHDVGNVPAILKEYAAPNARYITSVKWPEWGTMLGVSQFTLDQLLLVRGFDALHPEQPFEIAKVPLTETPPSVRNAEKLTVGDLDGDGIEEILFASPITQEIMVVRFPGKAAYPKAEVLMHSDDWGMPMRVMVEDLNQDGHVDLTVVDSAGLGKIHLLQNDGKGNFTEAGTIEFPLELFGKAIWQLNYGRDGDGALIAYAAGAGGQVLYHIDPQDPFHGWQHKILVSKSYDPSFDQVLTDLNGDRWLDVVLSRTAPEKSLMVIFGPLSSAFDEIAAKRVELK